MFDKDKIANLSDDLLHRVWFMAVALVYWIFKEYAGSISPGPLLQEFDNKTANLSELLHGLIKSRPNFAGD